MTPEISGSLARGRGAVANTQTYAAACRRLGLTALSAERIAELYDAEDGMRPDTLDADAAALTAAAAAAQDALASAHAASGLLAQAWMGRTGGAATDVLRGQCASAVHLIGGLRAAAGTLRTLRALLEDLMQIKADTAVSIDDRRSAERGRWLAHASAVLAGVPDESALDTVRREIAPYVNSDITGQWVPAMLRCSDAVHAAYADAVSSLSAYAPLRVETPAAVSGIRAVHTAGGREAAPAAPPIATPAVTPAATPTATPSVTPAAAPSATPPVPPVIPPASEAALPGGIGGAWSPATPWSSIAAPDRPRRRARANVTEHDDTDRTKDATDAENVVEEKDAADVVPAPAEPGPPPGAPEPRPTEPESAAVEPIPLPDTAAPLAAEAPDAAPADERTPCEIAADELPQVGG
ncbi:MAG: hypothetical protein FGM50_07790 [Mycobacterium sp.]|nr:hypothetical protein [Mycobacterium sp.]